jgi:hypothetical protein
MSFPELVVDTTEPKGDDIFYILPSKLSSSKYLAPNTFEQATIRNCPVEKISSGGLVGIFSSLRPLGKINIIVFQPIAVMIDYDCKQIEANLKLAGFEDISSSNINIKDEKTGHMIQTISIEATKPESKRNADITLEIKKTSYVEKPRGRQIREEPVKKEKYNFTTTTTTETTTSYKPRNKTYVRQEVKEEPVEDKKYSRRRFGQSTEYNNERPKHRTYVKEEKTEGRTGNGGYYRRNVKYTTSTSGQ